jgi:hypothetical protein
MLELRLSTIERKMPKLPGKTLNFLLPVAVSPAEVSPLWL